ncbi:MFS transporter [Amycolatopsis sp. 195334CR]|uniref:MFS transporter n=1 Tax=Amycolatopsis sp. 195334CR TaxID=2814588 RepID=UPI001A8E6E85|nr:MFS transporter [Amycolatopsis sp. 195334CR]MBN6039955.1 MFS transporter [Amycolatopsis sp. 195334CR]
MSFRRLWWATGCTSIGTGAATTALPLLAVSLSPDPRHVTLVAAATYLPWLLFALPAGALLDRGDRIGLMWRAQAVQVLLVGLLAALGHLGLAVVVLLAFTIGACEVLVGNGAQTVVPDLVAPASLHRANSAQQAVTTIGQQFAGPPLGSALFAVAAALPFGLHAAALTASTVLLATLPRTTHPRPTGTAMTDGLRWLARDRLLRTLALLLGANTFAGQLANATLVLLATQDLRLDATGYGLLLTAAAFGSVLAGLVTPWLLRTVGDTRALVASLVLNAGVFAGIGLSPNATVLAVLLATNGFLTTIWSVVTVSARQQLVPPGLLGRVNSAYRALGWGLMPLGALAGGFVAHGFGLRAPYLLAAALRLIALLLALPVLRRQET